MATSAPHHTAPPLAHFTVTVHASGVDVVDHADASRHTFGTLLAALGYMELVCRTRERTVRDGGLL